MSEIGAAVLGHASAPPDRWPIEALVALRDTGRRLRRSDAVAAGRRERRRARRVRAAHAEAKAGVPRACRGGRPLQRPDRRAGRPAGARDGAWGPQRVPLRPGGEREATSRPPPSRLRANLRFVVTDRRNTRTAVWRFRTGSRATPPDAGGAASSTTAGRQNSLTRPIRQSIARAITATPSQQPVETASASGRPAGSSARRGPPIRQAPPATAFRRPLPRRGRTRPGARSRRTRPQPDGLPRFLPGPGGRETPAAGTVRSARSMVAALMFNKPRRTSSARSRWPCRSMASTSVGSNGLRRLPQVRSDASLSTTRASRTASSYSRRPGR